MNAPTAPIVPHRDAEWIAYWGSAQVSIYANARHLAAHYEKLLADLESLLPKDESFDLLDFGCGDALMAPRLAEKGARVFLYDRVKSVQERLVARYSHSSAIKVLDDAAFAQLPEASFDRIIIISVIQYMDDASLQEWLARLGRLLKPQGELIVADVIAPGTSAIVDASALLSFAWKNGFFVAAFFSLLRTFFADYRRIRTRTGLSFYTEAAILERFARAGLKAARHTPNIGPTPHRMTFRAKRG